MSLKDIIRQIEKKDKRISELEKKVSDMYVTIKTKGKIKNCSTCKNNVEFPPPHTCDICTSLD